MRHQLLSSPLSLNFDLKPAKETGEYCDEDNPKMHFILFSKIHLTPVRSSKINDPLKSHIWDV